MQVAIEVAKNKVAMYGGVEVTKAKLAAKPIVAKTNVYILYIIHTPLDMHSHITYIQYETPTFSHSIMIMKYEIHHTHTHSIGVSGVQHAVAMVHLSNIRFGFQ